jgi:hypothetical protein
MNKFVLNFSKFISENRRVYDEEPTLSKEYGYLFSDFLFEDDVKTLIYDIEEKWIELKNQYWWNRESPDFRTDHFALDVKVYIWPEDDRIKDVLKVPELTEEECSNIWWKWMNDQRDVLTDGIDFAWVKTVGWGGKSGGLLLISPNVTQNDMQEQVEEIARMYKIEKEALEESGQMEIAKKFANTEEYDYMVKIGMVHEVDEVNSLRASIGIIEKSLTETLADLLDMETGLQQVVDQVERFRKEGLQWFYEYLQMEPDDALSGIY